MYELPEGIYLVNNKHSAVHFDGMSQGFASISWNSIQTHIPFQNIFIHLKALLQIDYKKV